MEAAEVNNDEADVRKDEFLKKICSLYYNKRDNTFLFTNERYKQMVDQVKLAKTKIKKTSEDYRRIKRFEVKDTPHGERLFVLKRPGQAVQQMFVPIDEMYDIIRKCHIKLNHAGRSKMISAIRPIYKNITTESVSLYLSLCQSCKNIRRKLRIQLNSQERERKAAISQSESVNLFEDAPAAAASDELNESDPFESHMETSSEVPPSADLPFAYPELYCRGQIDILDVADIQSEEYKYLIIYRHFVTRFTHLRPLKGINIEDIVNELLEIFLVFGFPNVLQSKNGMNVIKPICRRLTGVFPNSKVVSSSSNYTNDCFKDKTNQDILKKLSDWIELNAQSKWHLGLKFVQHHLNTTFNPVIGKSPSQAVFGVDPKRGVASCLSLDEYEGIDSEEDLKVFLEDKEKNESTAPRSLRLQESLIKSCSFVKIESETTENSDNGDVDDE